MFYLTGRVPADGAKALLQRGDDTVTRGVIDVVADQRLVGAQKVERDATAAGMPARRQ